ncbi:hypothetical protein HMPREF9012_1246 [Bacteroidetes bacterium oral taxon 272 str. F0290]|nr:hypothetical protein HMPREF9012_1246 [Bacteroidetes bacterium oral taxon 272 str. F0290]
MNYTYYSFFPHAKRTPMKDFLFTRHYRTNNKKKEKTIRLIYPQWQGGHVAALIKEVKDTTTASQGYSRRHSNVGQSRPHRDLEGRMFGQRGALYLSRQEIQVIAIKFRNTANTFVRPMKSQRLSFIKASLSGPCRQDVCLLLSVFLTIIDNVRHILFRPHDQRLNVGEQGMRPCRKSVFYPGRHLRINRSGDKSVFFQYPQRRGKHFLRDIRNCSSQVAETHLLCLRQCVDNQKRPFIAHASQNVANGTLRIVGVQYCRSIHILCFFRICKSNQSINDCKQKKYEKKYRCKGLIPNNRYLGVTICVSSAYLFCIYFSYTFAA